MPALVRNRGHRLAAYRRCSPDVGMVAGRDVTADEAYPEAGGEEGRGTADSSFQAGVWRTVSVRAPVEAVREALAASLRRRRTLTGLAIEGLGVRSGFVLRCTVGKAQVGAELVLAEWEAGTQVHLVIPREQKPSEAQLQRLRAWLELALVEHGWRVE